MFQFIDPLTRKAEHESSQQAPHHWNVHQKVPTHETSQLETRNHITTRHLASFPNSLCKNPKTHRIDPPTHPLTHFWSGVSRASPKISWFFLKAASIQL